MAKNTVAYIGATGVPMAVPFNWTQKVSLKRKMLCSMRMDRVEGRAACKTGCM
jgi:hypothetical protein